jgi:hypothetical protein
VKKLDGKVSSIRELLFGARFGIDYYQWNDRGRFRRSRCSQGKFIQHQIEE